jgi:hypothetical protein
MGIRWAAVHIRIENPEQLHTILSTLRISQQAELVSDLLLTLLQAKKAPSGTKIRLFFD